jgi:hypothetical protein
MKFMIPLRHGRSRQCRRVGHVEQWRRGRHRLPDCAYPVYSVPRSFLIHSYSLIGRKTWQQPRRALSLHNGAEIARA